MVKPILFYGSEVWGTEYSTIIESFHFTFFKYFLGVNSSVNNAVALESVGVSLSVYFILLIVSNTGVNFYTCMIIDTQRVATKCWKH